MRGEFMTIEEFVCVPAWCVCACFSVYFSAAVKGPIVKSAGGGECKLNDSAP